jgi:hypothetical protein
MPVYLAYGSEWPDLACEIPGVWNLGQKPLEFQNLSVGRAKDAALLYLHPPHLKVFPPLLANQAWTQETGCDWDPDSWTEIYLGGKCKL